MLDDVALNVPSSDLAGVSLHSTPLSQVAISEVFKWSCG